MSQEWPEKWLRHDTGNPQVYFWVPAPAMVRGVVLLWVCAGYCRFRCVLLSCYKLCCVCVVGRQIGRQKEMQLWVMGLESCRQNMMMDSLSVGMCELSMRYAEMITGKSTEEQSLQNGRMLRCTGASMHTIVEMCGQSVEVEAITDIANVKDNILVHKRDSHSCVGLRNMRASGFNHAEQVSCMMASWPSNRAQISNSAE